MGSNFLGDVSDEQISSIISGNELIAREGVNLTKSMNYRDKGPLLSVFIVLAGDDGLYRDEWNAETLVYIFEGHDSTTVESGKSKDQLVMYESGRVSENGKFYKAAHAFVDGLRSSPLQIQVYEKIDTGAFFDKGIFNLVDAHHVQREHRKVYQFHLIPADGFETGELTAPHSTERMLSASEKRAVWNADHGGCIVCGEQMGLRFCAYAGTLHLLCVRHRGEDRARGLLG